MPDRQTVAGGQHSPENIARPRAGTDGRSGALGTVPPNGVLAASCRKMHTATNGSRPANPAGSKDPREGAMPLLIALGFFVLITALVLWGSTFFGPENSSTKLH